MSFSNNLPDYSSHSLSDGTANAIPRLQNINEIPISQKGKLQNSSIMHISKGKAHNRSLSSGNLNKSVPLQEKSSSPGEGGLSFARFLPLAPLRISDSRASIIPKFITNGHSRNRAYSVDFQEFVIQENSASFNKIIGHMANLCNIMEGREIEYCEKVKKSESPQKNDYGNASRGKESENSVEFRKNLTLSQKSIYDAPEEDHKGWSRWENSLSLFPNDEAQISYVESNFDGEHQRCQLHPDDLRICAEDGCAICRECEEKYHRGHKLETLDEIMQRAEKKVEELRKFVEQCDTKIKDLQVLSKSIREAKIVLEDIIILKREAEARCMVLGSARNISQIFIEYLDASMPQSNLPTQISQSLQDYAPNDAKLQRNCQDELLEIIKETTIFKFKKDGEKLSILLSDNPQDSKYYNYNLKSSNLEEFKEVRLVVSFCPDMENYPDCDKIIMGLDWLMMILTKVDHLTVNLRDEEVSYKNMEKLIVCNFWRGKKLETEIIFAKFTESEIKGKIGFITETLPRIKSLKKIFGATSGVFGQMLKDLARFMYSLYKVDVMIESKSDKILADSTAIVHKDNSLCEPLSKDQKNPLLLMSEVCCDIHFDQQVTSFCKDCKCFMCHECKRNHCNTHYVTSTMEAEQKVKYNLQKWMELYQESDEHLTRICSKNKDEEARKSTLKAWNLIKEVLIAIVSNLQNASLSNFQDQMNSEVNQLEKLVIEIHNEFGEDFFYEHEFENIITIIPEHREKKYNTSSWEKDPLTFKRKFEILRNFIKGPKLNKEKEYIINFNATSMYPHNQIAASRWDKIEKISEDLNMLKSDKVVLSPNDFKILMIKSAMVSCVLIRMDKYRTTGKVTRYGEQDEEDFESLRYLLQQNFWEDNKIKVKIIVDSEKIIENDFYELLASTKKITEVILLGSADFSLEGCLMLFKLTKSFNEALKGVSFVYGGTYFSDINSAQLIHDNEKASEASSLTTALKNLTLSLDFKNVLITDNSTIEEWITLIKAVTVLDLYLNEKKIREEGFEVFTSKIAPQIQTLEGLSIAVSRDTSITDKYPISILSNLRVGAVKKFSFQFPKTQITDKSLEALKNMIKSSSNMVKTFKIDISGTWVTDEGLSYLMALPMPSVERLELICGKVNITDKSLKALREMLIPPMIALQTFKIDLSRTLVTDEGLCDLLSIPMMTIRSLTFNLSNIDKIEKGLKCFKEIMIPTMKELGSLTMDLSYTSVTDEAIYHLFGILATTVSYIEFNFTNMNISEKSSQPIEGLEKILVRNRSESSWFSLNMNFNEAKASERCLRSFLIGILAPEKLDRLTLNLSNTSVTDETLQKISNLICFRYMKDFYFNISGTNVTDTGVAILSKNILSAMKEIKEIELNLSKAISDESIGWILENIPQTVEKLTLMLEDTQATVSTYFALAKALPSMKALEELRLNLKGIILSESDLIEARRLLSKFYRLKRYNIEFKNYKFD